MTSDIKPLFEEIRFAGTAVNVKTIVSDLAAAFKYREFDLADLLDITASAVYNGCAQAAIDGRQGHVFSPESSVGRPMRVDHNNVNLQRIRSEYWIYFRLRQN